MSPWIPGMTLEQAEIEAISRTLEFCGGNKPWAAKALRICIRTLRNRVRDADELAPYRGVPRRYPPSRIRITQG